MKKTTEKRLEEITNYLILNQKVSTKELSELTNVSPEMIRRDLAVLEEKGLIIRTHGGAIVRENTMDIPFSARKYENKKIKDELCRHAIDYVKNGDVVFIDPSTTSLQLGRLLKLRKNITLVTNCLELLNVASDTGHKIIFLGGEYSKSGDRTIGLFALYSLRKIQFDIAFFGTDGCMNMDGPGTIAEEEILINEEVLKRSKTNVLMMDSSKLKRTAKFVYADFSQFDILVIDEIDDETRNKINIKTIDVINS